MCNLGEPEMIAKTFKTKQCKTCVGEGFRMKCNYFVCLLLDLYANGLTQLQMVFTDTV
jgi:hypothetical protein